MIDLGTFLNNLKDEIILVTPQVMLLREQRSLKEDASFVTDGDMLINSCIKRLIEQQQDEIVVISEEEFAGDDNLSSGYVVVVDPIDGTENFTSGLPEWGVSISCFYEGMHIGSLLGCPEMNRWLCSGDNVHSFFSRIRGLSSSLQKDELIRATQGHEYRIMGCCVYNMMNVIRGSFLSFENPKGAHSWDILGGLNLALEHKLKVTVNDKPYSGEYLPADKKYRFRVEH